MIGENDVKKLAELARLSISDDEIAHYARELDAILSYVQQLQELNTNDIKPMSHVHGSVNVFREDEVSQSLSVDDVLRNTPDVSGRFIRVPIIIEPGTEH